MYRKSSEPLNLSNYESYRYHIGFQTYDNSMIAACETLQI